MTPQKMTPQKETPQKKTPEKKTPENQTPENQQTLLKQLPEEQRLIYQQYLEASYSGPLPPPAALEKYEKIQPGAADRIISMAEKEQSSRIAAQTEGSKRGFCLLSRGQIFAFITALLAICAGIMAIYKGLQWCGIAFALLPALLVGFFLFRKEISKRSPSEKEKD